MAPDPYTVLGVAPTASDADVRAAYRRLVKLHHPDHNGGSPEAARRFEAVQEAFAEVHRRRRVGDPQPPRPAPPTGTSDDMEARLAELENQVREARRAREHAQRAAAQAAAAADPGDRPTDEELGYIRTDDSFWKILDDTWDELTERYDDVRQSEHPAARRVNDLIDGLRGLSEKIDRPKRPRRP